MDSATQFIFQIVILIFSVVIHEVSHGYAALALGDKTAQYAGRLTLNPLKHLDPFGSVFLPFLIYWASGGSILFGWAKPVPFNPYNLRNQKWGPALVGAVGPLANFSLALIFGLLVRFSSFFVTALPGSFLIDFITIASTIALLNLVLAIFNLVPIPPLDGSKVLLSALPYQWRDVGALLEQYSFFLLVIFIYFFSGLLTPIVIFLFRLITSMSPF